MKKHTIRFIIGLAILAICAFLVYFPMVFLVFIVFISAYLIGWIFYDPRTPRFNKRGQKPPPNPLPPPKC